jgi:hypothetical protein
MRSDNCDGFQMLWIRIWACVFVRSFWSRKKKGRDDEEKTKKKEKKKKKQKRGRDGEEEELTKPIKEAIGVKIGDKIEATGSILEAHEKTQLRLQEVNWQFRWVLQRGDNPSNSRHIFQGHRIGSIR